MKKKTFVDTRMNEIGQKLLVLSGKGGVGKSTVAVNLAVSLAMSGMRTGLLDVDLHGPTVPRLLGLEGRRLGPGPHGGIEPIHWSENLLVVSIGLLLESESDAVIWRGPIKYKIIVEFLEGVSWGRLDCLVVDLPPGTGDEPLSIAQKVGADARAVIVTTPQDVAVADVRRSISFCRKLSLDIAGIVENMSGLVCPHCKSEMILFGTGGGDKLAAETGVPLLGCIPVDPRIVISCDEGKPSVQHHPRSRTSKAFAAIVHAIMDSGVVADRRACSERRVLQ
jgi:Mrp family chromosome partitioning ATPase